MQHPLHLLNAKLPNAGGHQDTILPRNTNRAQQPDCETTTTRGSSMRYLDQDFFKTANRQHMLHMPHVKTPAAEGQRPMSSPQAVHQDRLANYDLPAAQDSSQEHSDKDTGGTALWYTSPLTILGKEVSRVQCPLCLCQNALKAILFGR